MYNFNKNKHYNNGDYMKEKEINVMDELNKGCSMGLDAINYVMDKVEDESFKELLTTQYEQYEKLSKKICKLFPEYNKEREPKETNTMNKVMTWYGINMKTLTDHSNSKIAELLIQGTNMGIIEGRKLLNHKNGDEEVDELVSEYVDMQERALERLKEFL